MDFITLENLLQSNFFANFITTYIATTVMDSAIKKVEDRNQENGIEKQLCDCMQDALYDTCKERQWEYNSNAFWSVCSKAVKERVSFLSETTLIAAFVQAVGHPITREDIQCWEYYFQQHLASKKYEQLREFIKLQFLFEKKGMPLLQKKYIKKFYKIQKSYNDQCLTLANLYIPNRYHIGSSEYSYNDLLELIYNFKDGTVEDWLRAKGINQDEQIDILFILGHQCTGKSTLISKIISDYYMKNEVTSKQLHVVSFSEKSFRNKEVSVESICQYLAVGEEQLQNSLLLIDGLDESETIVARNVINNLEELINELRELECRAIITSRPFFQMSNNLQFTLNISLDAFSIDQAKEWLEIYSAVCTYLDTSIIEKQIKDLSVEIRKVILIPYVFFVCVENSIAISQITELGRLYDLLFCGKKEKLFKTPYNPKARNLSQDWSQFEKIVTCKSIEYLNSADNTFSLNDIDNINLMHKISSEFFVYLSEDNKYSFIHDSIAHYFVARDLFNLIILKNKENDMCRFVEHLNETLSFELVLSTDTAEFIRYFVRNNQITNYDFLIDFLKAFLNKQFQHLFVIEANLEKIERYYYNRFVSIVRLVLAFIMPNIKRFSKFDLFERLNENEIAAFIKYTNLGNIALKCLHVCDFSGKILDNINLSGADLKGNRIHNVRMRHALLKETELIGAYLLDSDFTLSNFYKASCQIANFSNSILVACSFEGATLNGADFSNTNLENADFRGATICKTKFAGAKMTGVKVSIEQLYDMFEFDINFIKKNKIQVYMDDKLISDEILEKELKCRYPVKAAFYMVHP